MYDFTWEQTVHLLRQQPNQDWLTRDCYFDDPLIDAAKRFSQSQEWEATRKFLPNVHSWVLDLGAGRGISSYALAREGWFVVASEPDPSDLVGTQAIAALAKESRLPIFVVQNWGEALPVFDNTFDLVYVRQVLHHAHDLDLLCREVCRILKPGGRFIATREHVISRPEDLTPFLENHVLHRFFGGENAYLLDNYVHAIANSGMRILKVVGPFDSVVNYYPLPYVEWRKKCIEPMVQRFGLRITNLLTNQKRFVGRWLMSQLAAQVSRSTDEPGRMYTFIARKP